MSGIQTRKLAFKIEAALGELIEREAAARDMTQAGVCRTLLWEALDRSSSEPRLNPYAREVRP